jgi:glycosyltransferase involved in cell wall biosynthesis
MLKRDLHLGIDAINIRQGGGLTHLSQLLQAADPITAGFDVVTVWSSQATANELPILPWLVKRTAPWIEAALPRRMLGQQFQLAYALEANGCDVLFSPGGLLPHGCRLPKVTMAQNMLPFEPLEALRFGRFGLMRLKMRLLRHLQGRSFRRAQGLMFLTHYAEKEISRVLGGFSCPTVLVPHGIEPRFLQAPRTQRPLSECTLKDPFRVLYVSILMPYKHQLQVAKAAAELRSQGLPIEIRFVGASWGQYGMEFKRLIESLDPHGTFLKWSGHEPFDSLHRLYGEADAFVFASSCENLPNILIEAMAAGLPIACSKRGPMPEVLGDAGVYFDPESQGSIASALRVLANNHDLRTDLAQQSWQKAQNYSWERCANETFEFIAKIARQHSKVSDVRQ